MRNWPRLGGLLVLLVLAWPGPGPAEARPAIGISERHESMFEHPEYAELGLPAARLVVPWNAALTEVAHIDRWLAAAAAAGAEPMVAFEKGRSDACPSDPCVLPSDAAFAAAFETFRARWPGVTRFSPWNEANHHGQPTAADPEAAAHFYEIVRDRCAGCEVTAADVLDQPNMATWLTAFRSHVTGDPQLWGLHNYGDTNRFRTTGTETMLGLAPGDVWLTETGGIVHFVSTTGAEAFPYDEQRAADALEYLFGWIIPTFGQRIPLAFVHQWRTFDWDRFDAGLVSPAGAARPSLAVLRRALGLDLPAPGEAAGGGDGAAGGAGGPGATGEASRPGAAVLAAVGLRVARPGLRRLRLRRDGTVRIALGCPRAQHAGCAATLRLRTARAVGGHFRGKPARRVQLGRGRVALRTGAAGVFRIRLGRRLQRVLRRERAVPVLLEAATLAEPGRWARLARLTLRAAR